MLMRELKELLPQDKVCKDKSFDVCQMLFIKRSLIKSQFPLRKEENRFEISQRVVIESSECRIFFLIDRFLYFLFTAKEASLRKVPWVVTLFIIIRKN